MNRQTYIEKTLQFEIEVEKLKQQFFEECYLPEATLKSILPHKTKVKILPTRDYYNNRNIKNTKITDPCKIVGKNGEIDLTYNQYSESYINVRFPQDENNPTSYQRLVPYYQLEVLEA